jgi:co-chaperonin GroES (HSP10)
VRNPMVGERGTVIVTNDNMISYRINEKGAVYYLIRNSAIMGTVNPDSFEITPEQHYVLVKENEPAALALSSRGPIWVPTMDMETDDEGSRHQVGLRAEYGEVVATGPGRWNEGQLQKPTQRPGDMVLYDCSHSTLAVTIRGARFTLVACTQIAQTYRGAGYSLGAPPAP